MTAKKVLVIDDSIMIRKMVKSILSSKYEVLEASDGKSGLEAARRSFPDLILLDFVMPKYNGYQTLQAIRRVEGLQEVPVIMISGLKEQVTEHVPEPFTEFDFLEKPFEADVLVSRIQKMLNATGADGSAPVTATTSTTGASYTTSQTAATDASGAVTSSGMQVLINKLNSTENLLVQGIDNLIQRELVARMNEFHDRLEKQETSLVDLQQRLDKISQQLDHQNKGLMVILREIKVLQGSPH
ncbi:MAG: response regulator [Pseudanabaena sp. ELA607]|jgi:DNA-binding response OmpR family regulator